MPFEFNLYQLRLSYFFYLLHCCVPLEIGIKYREDKIGRQMTYFMQPLTFPKKSITQLFNYYIQKNALLTQRFFFTIDASKKIIV